MSEKRSHEPCAVCTKTPTDRAHIQSRGAGGSWDYDNILMLCRTHHQHQHQYGWSKFITLYPQVGRALAKKGWEIQEVFGVKKLVRK